MNSHQTKKQKEIANFRKNLEVGQSVVTAGGIYGKIKEIEDNTVVVEVAAVRYESLRQHGAKDNR